MFPQWGSLFHMQVCDLRMPPPALVRVTDWRYRNTRWRAISTFKVPPDSGHLGSSHEISSQVTSSAFCCRQSFPRNRPLFLLAIVSHAWCFIQQKNWKRGGGKSTAEHRHIVTIGEKGPETPSLITSYHFYFI